MASELRFDGKVAVVTGAGNGLGRAHALLLASRGARVVVNDLGGSAFGEGKSAAAADVVVAEIKEAGGEAVANYDSVEDGARIIETAMDTWGQVDIVINNAGILRDVSFAKLTPEDWDLVYRVHVLGAFRVTHAAWPHMREAQYGRIVMTSSAAGLYGNFGQANYAMAKLGLVGFAQTLALEGQRRNILVNAIAPIAGSRMTETVLPQSLLDALKPEYVSPIVAYLAHESCEETGGTFEVGGGFFSKLRWERAAGKMFRVGRQIAIEDVARSWAKITGFDESTHPASVTESMAPILNNVNAGPSKGGNQFIDVDEALGYAFPEATSSYDERDLQIYALGVGAAEDASNEQELAYVYEMHGDGFRPLPTFGVVPAINLVLDMGKRGETAPGMNYGLDRILHGEQYTELLLPLPKAAKLRHQAKITDIYDKGKNALILTETKSYDEDDNLIIINRATTVIRGAGGWGGDRGPTDDINTPPEREPDVVTEQKISPNQALLYRLSGDWNPLHADPGMAVAFGFEKPILHGLCTFGYAGRHVINAFAPGGDSRFFKSIQVRFADPVFPGETLVTKMWKESDTKVIFECAVKERDKNVITRAAVEFHTEIPHPPEKADQQAEVQSTEPSEDEVSTMVEDVFIAIDAHIRGNSDLIASISKVYQFALTSPNSLWTLDLKSGRVAAGEETKPDCTLALSTEDFMRMTQGEVDPMKLYMDGALKISGDLLASQKLDFLQKIDPEDAKKAVAAARAAGTSLGDSSVEGSASESIATQFFENFENRVNKTPALAAEVAAVVHIKLTEPESAWTLNFKDAHEILTGLQGEADMVLTLSEETLAAWAGGASEARLHQRGEIRVDGDITVIGRMGVIKGLI